MPSGEKQIELIVLVCPSNMIIYSPVFQSQIRIDSSQLDANIVPSGEEQIDETNPVWSDNLLFYSPVLQSQRITELSSLLDANIVPSEE